MKLLSHPIWLVGFRPFFLLACAAGALLPALWVAMLSGALPAPTGRFSPLQWHAHEMFFGFGWAVMGGFLLTATKNWVQVRGYHGGVLIALVLLWLFERAGMIWAGAWPDALFWLSNLGYLSSVVALLLWTLLRHRRRDSFRDNPFFYVVLPAFIAAKWLLLDPAGFQAGVSVCIGLLRLAFLLMLERTLTQFMKNGLQIDILRDARLDVPIKVLGLAVLAQPWLPVAPAFALLCALATLLGWRLLFWAPMRGMRRIELAVMYLGYLALTGQVALEAMAVLETPRWIGSVSVHLFATGVMGLIVPAMLVRISKGHTGHAVHFDAGDRLVLWIMFGALVARLVLPQCLPTLYLDWLRLAAAGWLLCFGALALRVAPRLLQARVDGKVH